MNVQRSEAEEVQGPDVIRWGVGCALGSVALIGVAILVFLVSLALQPPTWVQIVLGIVLTLGAAVFTWLIVAAQKSSRAVKERDARSTSGSRG